MLCIEYNKKSKLKVSEKPIPKINSDEALIKLDACGVCGSDLVKIKNGLVPEGTVLGHEIVGTIVETGSLTRNWSKGQKVVVAHHVPCLNCHYCKSGNFSMCAQFKKTNITPGGFAEYIKLTKAHLEQTTFLIPRGTVSDHEIALTEPLACCIRAVDIANITATNSILISGLGSIGNLIGKICIEKGANTIGTDVLDERLKFALNNETCSEVYSAKTDELKESIMKKTDGRGVDTIFLASGNEKALDDAIKLVRSGGQIIIFSSTPKKKGIDNNEIYYRELTIQGCYSPSPMSLKEAYQLIITGKLKLKELISDVVKLKDLPLEIDKCFENKSLKMVVEN